MKSTPQNTFRYVLSVTLSRGLHEGIRTFSIGMSSVFRSSSASLISPLLLAVLIFPSTLAHGSAASKPVGNTTSVFTDSEIHELLIDRLVQGIRTGETGSLIDLFNGSVVVDGKYYNIVDMKEILERFISTGKSSNSTPGSAALLATNWDFSIDDVRIILNGTTGFISGMAHFGESFTEEHDQASEIHIFTSKIRNFWYIVETEGLFTILSTTGLKEINKETRKTVFGGEARSHQLLKRRRIKGR